MAFANLLDANTYAKINDPRTIEELIKARKDRQIELAKADAEARQRNLSNDFNDQTMDSRVTQEANQATNGGLTNQGLTAGLPVLQLGGKQAQIETNYLDQMFPGASQAQGQAQALPPQFQSAPAAAGAPAPDPASAQDAPPASTPPQIANQFAAKSLDELRQMKANAGPTGAFLGKFIDPIIERKAYTEEVVPAIKEISAAAALPGGTHDEIRAKNAAVSAVLAKYPAASNDPRVKEAMQAALKSSADFNPASMMGVTNRLYGPLLTDWRSAREKYEKQYGEPFLQIQGIKKSGAYGTSLGDQSMIDKLIIMETGTKPTEAQYANLSEKIGFGDIFDIAAGKFRDGQQLSAKMRKNLESEIEEQARIGHAAYADNMTQAKEQARLMQLDPEAVIRPGGSFGQVDAFMKAPHVEEPVKAGTKAEYDALPSGTVYIGPSGKKAKKP